VAGLDHLLLLLVLYFLWRFFPVEAQVAHHRHQAQPDRPVLVYSTADPTSVQAVQARLGVEHAGALVETALAAVARRLVSLGVRQLVVAGGETSGACVQALQIGQMRIGAQIDPGVPWCHAISPAAPQGLHIALKSGNFGAPDFFGKAFEHAG